MATRKETPLMNKAEMLSRNRGINKSTVVAHEKLERELERLGVEIKPKYNLEPPLGPTKIQLRSQNRE